MKTLTRLLTIALGFTGALVGGAANAVPYTFTTIDYPGGSATDLFSINNAGVMAGGHSEQFGFIRDINGQFTEINVPGSTFTEINKINDNGIASGDFFDTDGYSHAFQRAPDGTINVLPDIATNPALFWAFNTSSSGTVVGVWSQDFTFATWRAYSYEGGVYSDYIYPGALRTQFNDINDAGQIVGRFSDASGVFHGLLIDGTTTLVIDVPGADSTHAFALNNNGDIAGYYTKGDDVHGFVLDDGIFTTIDVPSETGTRVYDINDKGQLVGTSDERGFLANPVPEPQSALLFGLALVALVGASRARRHIQP